MPVDVFEDPANQRFAAFRSAGNGLCGFEEFRGEQAARAEERERLVLGSEVIFVQRFEQGKIFKAEEYGEGLSFKARRRFGEERFVA